ncbi:MAG: tetratricopeptide repeat protein, partial [Anaerolineales bacterium]
AYVLELRGDALVAAGDYAAALIDYRAALQSPSFLNGLLIEIKIARAHAAVGDYETALGMYQSIYERAQTDFTKAQMDYLMGQAYAALGQLDNAYAAYQDAVNNFPTSYDSYLALVQLVDAGVPVDELNRGIVDYYAGEYGVAIAAFDRYFQLNGVDQATARYYNGLALRALGGYPDAVNQWDIIIQNYPDDRFWDDVWEQKAYTQWYYQRQTEDGIRTLLDFVAAAPAHLRAGEFLYDAAEVAEIHGLLDQAAELWGRVAVEYPEYEEAQRAGFLEGITRYRLGDIQKAADVFQSNLASAVTLRERAAAAFWQGKTQQAIGDPAAAQATWELTANIDPTGYYSERARDILRQLEPFSPPQDYDLSIDLQGERLQAEDWMRTTFNIAPEEDLSSLGPLLGDERLFRGSELWELGLYDEARVEFEDLRASLQSDP